MSQPLNRLAPFEILGQNGLVVFEVNDSGVVTVDEIIYADGSIQTSAAPPVNLTLTNLDEGTF